MTTAPERRGSNIIYYRVNNEVEIVIQDDTTRAARIRNVRSGKAWTWLK
jgi:hypothetical protein